jgi:hypothetical protein
MWYLNCNGGQNKNFTPEFISVCCHEQTSKVQSTTPQASNTTPSTRRWQPTRDRSWLSLWNSKFHHRSTQRHRTNIIYNCIVNRRSPISGSAAHNVRKCYDAIGHSRKHDRRIYEEWTLWMSILHKGTGTRLPNPNRGGYVHIFISMDSTEPK